MTAALKTYLPAGRMGRVLILLFCLIISIAVIGLWGLKTGYPLLSWKELFAVLSGSGSSELAVVSVLEIRLPRLVLGAIVGMLLAIAGVILQDSLKNPLAGPELLGVSAGASFIMAVVTVLHLQVSFHSQPWLALAGGLIGGGVVLAAARGRHGGVSFILIGAAVTAIMNGLIVWIVTMGTQNDTGLLYHFMLGSLANRNWVHVQHMLPWAAIGIPLALLFAKPLNVLRLGDETAESLGINVARMRFLMLFVCCGLVAAVVSQCGPIGYIALIAPHLVRLFLGSSDARLALPLAALAGAALLLGADILARVVFAPREVPVGLWTTLIGGPLLIGLFMRTMRGERHESE